MAQKKEFVNRSGSWFTLNEALAVVCRATGATRQCLDYLRVGGIYSNGGIWFQRIS